MPDASNRTGASTNPQISNPNYIYPGETIHLPGGSHATLINSIKEKLLPLGDDVGFICGHGAGSSIGQERMTNPFITGEM